MRKGIVNNLFCGASEKTGGLIQPQLSFFLKACLVSPMTMPWGTNSKLQRLRVNQRNQGNLLRGNLTRHVFPDFPGRFVGGLENHVFFAMHGPGGSDMDLYVCPYDPCVFVGDPFFWLAST